LSPKLPRIILNEAKGLTVDFYLQRLHDAITTVVRGMNLEDLTRHPAGASPEKLCAAEVLEHLYLTYTDTIRGFERALNSGRPMASSPTLKQRVATTLVVGLGHMPGGRQAPERTRPRGASAEKVVADIGSRIVAMDELIARSEERHGKRTKLLDHPMLGPLTGKQWRKFHWVHGQHHVKQIQKLREWGRG